MCIVLKVKPLQFCSFCGNRGKSILARSFSCYKTTNIIKCTDVKQRSFVTNKISILRWYSASNSDLISANETIISRYLSSLMVECKTSTDLFNKLTYLNNKNVKIVLELLTSRAAVCESLKSLEELKSGDSKDKELASLVQTEKDDYKLQLESLDYDLVMSLLPEEPHDKLNDLVIEIKHGVGGQEAMLFANDVFEMYCNYISYKGWRYDIAEASMSEIGGLRSSSILVYGTDAYRYFCYEGGVHRVQRVPSTERSGRIHTSTVSVAILPQPTEIEIVIADKDLKIETKRASGAGGQHVNTTDSAIRISHLPTGTVVECQEDRSQQKNRQIAMQRLRAKLYETQINEQFNRIRTNRKLQVGTSSRSEKIRTYNFNQDRITDHRIGLSLFNMESFLKGGELLDKMLEALQKESELERLLEFINNLKTS